MARTRVGGFAMGDARDGSSDRLAERMLETWRIHDGVHLELLAWIPLEGPMAIPAESLGADGSGSAARARGSSP